MIGSSLNQVLVELGIITEEQAARAWQESGGNEQKLAEVLIDRGFATESQIIKGIGLKHNAPYFESLEGIIAPDARELLDEKIARRYQVAPLFAEDDRLMVAMLNPFDLHTLDVLARETGRTVSPVISTRRAIFSAINAIYLNAIENAAGAPAAPASAGEGAEDFSWLNNLSLWTSADAEAPVIRLVDSIVREGIRVRAADIHIQPEADKVVVLFRLDGFLKELLRLPAHVLPALTARVKILARLDIAESRLPQDGHIPFQYQGREIDLRVSTLPTITGEKTVLRILDRQGLILDIAQLGFPAEIRERLEKLLVSPHGILLVTGPTGSGKTTTLYSLIAGMRGRALNISTLEDPVEYQVEGISQVSVKSAIGFTFARGLRALLRQDPDIILVGEIRDNETAAIAINASMTGHFILSTLHTNDAASAVARLVNMEVDPYLITVALRGVIAQRLVRRLCPDCRQSFTPAPALVERLGLAAPTPLFRPKGCRACQFTGYRGRVGVYEMLVMNEDLNEAIMERAPVHVILERARSSGFRDMLALGVEKVLSGVTSPEELIRVTRGH